MTEHTTPTTPQEDATRAAEIPTSSSSAPGGTAAGTTKAKPASGATLPPGGKAKAVPGDKKPYGAILAAIAIILALLLAAALYMYGARQAKTQNALNQQLQSRVEALQQTQQQQQQQSQAALQQQGLALGAAQQLAATQARQLDELRDKVATISGSDANTWLLAQADFLVKQAGRKLWNDQDIVTAGALLKSADASLADMNDPSLMNVRRAITEDIAALSGVSQVDFDGIILKVNQLSNQVDNLRLADNDSDESPMDSDGGSELSGSVREWRQNLSKSWHNFMNDFITIRRRDTSAEPLLAPNQDIYLRENIRSRLLIAAQAVPRHQNEVYRQSLESVSTWVRAYFDADDANTRAFLAELDDLGQQNITMDVPAQLSSQPLLEKLVQTRVRNLLAQPSAATADAPAATPAGQGE
ncbi:uroporphyrinogen-III C-methyltransferase [Acerihabitans arboris]|uniref:Uroporphyrinogen-III C-methyltransferase n=1 Tax=Acerihabitans arboris TaxID=2691583 RepID=A0A845SMG5_9GAMM|nr:uroporphyrinogen-III C-methyltransferase [Acerihabitans arboris]NDL64407.1 uroporphyrinogen-III C-methyltransferase [Acerihabitans arboris]